MKINEWRKCGKFLVPYQRFVGINERKKIDGMMNSVWQK